MEQDRTTQATPEAERSATSLLAILRRRWWLIAALMVGAIGVTLIVALSTPPEYRSSLRMQVLALDDQEVTLFTNLRSLAADEQIAVTQHDFREVLTSPLIAWRTINALGLDISAQELLDNLTVTASGEFMSVAYDADSPQAAFDILTTHVENALEHYSDLRARPASANGQFLEAELEKQNQLMLAAQDALLTFQLEHNVGDLNREINAVQDSLRNLQTNRDSAQVQANQANALAQLWARFAQEAEAELATLESQLAEIPTPEPAPVPGDETPAAPEDGATAILAALQQRYDQQADNAERYRANERGYLADATSQQASITQHEALISQRSADLSQLISLSSAYNALVSELRTAEADFEFLRDKAAEARLKERQVVNVGSLQVVEPAVLPTSAAPSPVLRLVLLAALVSLLVGLVLALLLDFISPTRPEASQPQ